MAARRTVERDDPFSEDDKRRFYANMGVAPDADACWRWLGTTRDLRGGYGEFLRTSGGRDLYYRAHRVAYELFCGPVAEGLFVCHDCDNPVCIRPDHLFLGTVVDNNRDMFKKHRDVGARKLTRDDVRSIRAQIASGDSHSTIAARFGVTPSNVSAIARGKSWSRLPDIKGEVGNS